MKKLLLAIPLAATLAACSSTATDPATESSMVKDDGSISIVASTNVWGDVASTVVPDAEVTSIIDGDDTDPHFFEPTAADMAKAKAADIVVVGGGGYDAWLYSAIDPDKIVHALPLTEHDHDHEHGDHEGHDHDHGETGHDDHDHDHEGHHHDHGDHDADGLVNEHIWYDTHAVQHVGADLAEAAKKLGAEASTDTLDEQMHTLHEKIDHLPAVRVAQTEPIADYIINHSPMIESTPEGYRHTTLSEAEPTAADVSAFLDLINSGELDVLVYNPQTETPTTKRLLDAANANNVSVVEISETPEKGQSFYDFFTQAVDRLAAVK